jgi:hypothetical protein
MTPLERYEMYFAPTLIDVYSATNEIIASNITLSKATRLINASNNSVSRALYAQRIYTNRKTKKSYKFKLCKKND